MKKLIKNIILLTTIFSLCFGFRVWAAADPDTYAFELSSEGTGEIDRAGGAGFYGKIVSATLQGNYTLLIDDCGDEGLVNTSQWSEYQSLLSQGSPEVIMVDIGWSESGPGGENFYVISGYQLAGQTEVKLPKENQIKIKDPFNCDQLSILKYLGNQLGSSYVFNQSKREQEIKENNARINAERAKQESKEAIYDDFKEALNEYNETYLSTKEMMSATSEAAAKAREIKDNIKEKIKQISSDNHAIDSNVHGAYDKFMEYYNKIKDKLTLGAVDLGIVTMKIIMESEYGTDWDSAYIKCMKENNGNWKSHTTMNVKWTKGDGLIHKFNITEEWFGLKYLYGWILTNEEYNEILSEVKTRCVESYEELISTKYPKALGDERKKIWHRYSMYIGGAAFKNELDSFCKEYEKTIEANQDAIDKRNANKEEVYNKLEEYDKE